jgi:hypothetical protein
VQIRGDSVGNPVLLFLHGAPDGAAIVLGTGWREWENISQSYIGISVARAGRLKKMALSVGN